MIFRKGELFSGPGGLAYGAKNLCVADPSGEEYRVEHTWAYDIDESACETYRNNICPDKKDSVRNEDVRDIDIDKTEPIDAFTFGFPCNDYSNVGKKKGIKGEYGPLYTYGVKVIEKHNPKWFLAENVGGLESADDGNTFLQMLEDLSSVGEHGYTLTSHLYRFQDYGVPQSRHRIIIVGIRKDLGLEFKVPAPTCTKYKTSREALEEPPIAIDAPNHDFTKHPQSIIDRLNHIPPGENAWYEGIPEHLRLNVKGAKLSNIYKRLDPDKPAYTVTGSGGGGTHMYHYSEPRALTNRERARLQSFPDTFVFYGKKESVRKQIGMAVPPDGARVIFEAILKTFANQPYETTPSKWPVR